MQYRLTALTLFSAALIIPAAAQAGGHTADKFLQADTDGNSLVSLEEYLADKEAKFLKMDADGDGSVSGSEYEGYIHSKMDKKKKEKHMKHDHDDDGDHEVKD